MGRPPIEYDPEYEGKAETADSGAGTSSGGSSLTLSEEMRSDSRPWYAAVLGFFHSSSKTVPDDRFAKVKVTPVVDYPAGYPQYAALIDCDANFRSYRRFGILRNRVILHRQHELVQLEKALEELDKRDAESHRPELNFRLQSIGYDEAQSDSPRKDLIEKIDKKLEHYDALLARERESLSMHKPTERNHQSLINYLWNGKSIAQDEIEYLNRADDFVILAKDQDSFFHARLENLLAKKAFSWIQPVFLSEMESEKARGSEELDIRLFSKKRVNVLIRVIVTLITVALIMVPVCLLFTLSLGDKVKVGFVLIFVVAFPIAISVFARPKSHELFAATAAYTAVLVVFLTSFSGDASQNDGVSLSE